MGGRLLVAMLVGLFVSALALPGETAASGTRFSGRLVTVDPAKQTLTFEEMGPWTPHRRGLTKRTIELVPGAQIKRLSRTAGKSQTGWIGGFTESAVGLSDLKPGDWVTVVVTPTREPKAVSIETLRLANG